MGEAEETYTVYVPQTDDSDEAMMDLVRQLNVIFRQIAEKIADKADA